MLGTTLPATVKRSEPTVVPIPTLPVRALVPFTAKFAFIVAAPATVSVLLKAAAPLTASVLAPNAVVTVAEFNVVAPAVRLPSVEAPVTPSVVPTVSAVPTAIEAITRPEPLILKLAGWGGSEF